VTRAALIALLVVPLLSTAARAEEHAAGVAVAPGREISAPPAGPGEHRLHFKVLHKHSRDEARARTQYLFDYWKKRFGVTSRWDGDRAVASGNIMGISFTAWVEVTDTQVAGESTDPGFFTRGVAYAYIENKLKKYMHPNYDEP
jgi:hypothetical protein